ncbi:leucyl aminopeptidase [Catenovulum sp. SM1970]|uniref:leucyl aminopeptidase n=1 Tax=Marinifaba aquimaris TaxID=2741323 RepID=UPI0015727C30|nr:leucyl aminopeptidase [Marinifaba aquimaris]NTS78565.1 leucyl aminopeptidase [Marinifaba aquimaris]
MNKIIGFCLTILFSASTLAMPDVKFSDVDLKQSNQLVVFIDSTEELKGSASTVNKHTNGQLLAAIKASNATIKLGSTKTFYGLTPYNQVTVVGTGKSPLTQSQLQDIGGAAIAAMPANGKTVISILTDNLTTQVTDAESWIAMGAAMRDYHFDKYKKADAKTEPRKLVVQSNESQKATAKYQGDLAHLVKGIYLARDMASEPGKSIYPQAFVERVEDLFDDIKNVDIDVLKVKQMKKYKMGALLGVGQGSIHDPRMLVIEYNGADDDSAPIALVGKGITFDTGGISLKKNTGMWAMKSDLSGAAAVAGTMLAVASRGEKVNLVGVIPLAENMPSQDAIRPGDVLTTMQGTTIEIMSTDAEGRLILADAVRYAQDKYKPSMLVNIATLTGSAVRALSDEYAGLVTRDWALTQKMMDLGEISGESVWPLPLHPNHFTQIESPIADIKNSGAGNPGASIGAAVVATFIDKDLPWVHLDIAGVDWLETDINVAPKGSQGWGVRFMDQLVRENIK